MNIGHFQLLGDEELLRKLDSLKKSMRNQIVRKACKEAAKPIKQQVKNNCMTMLGHIKYKFYRSGAKKGQLKKVKGESSRLKESFSTTMARAVTIWPKRKRRSVGARVVFDTKRYFADLVYYPLGSLSNAKTKKTFGRRTFIPAAIEFGHKLVFFGKETKKRVKGIPVWKEAFLSKAGEAIRIGRDEIRRLLEIEAKKKV